MSGTRPSLALCLASLITAAAAPPAAPPAPPGSGDGQPGDVQRGYAVVIRQTSTCTLCHAGPFPNPHLQGTVGPDLHGIGARKTPEQIRAQIVDASRFNPDTLMPSFGTTTGRVRVGGQWQGKPILTDQEIDDATAYLATLK